MTQEKSKPQLRFPGFSDDWISNKLGDIGNFKNGINKSREDFGFGCPFVNLLDVFGVSKICNKNYDLINVDANEVKNYSVKKGDVLFVRFSLKPTGVGLTVVALENLRNTVYSGFLIRFRDDNNFLNVHFKIYCFSTTNFRNTLQSKSTTSANTNINQVALSSLYLFYPSLSEQEKIAKFMMSIDKNISILEKQKTKLEDYKNTLSTRLLTQGKKCVPLRFKGFINIWEQSQLGNLSNIKKGQQLNKEYLTSTGKYYVLNGGRQPSGFYTKFNTNKNTISISEGGESCGYVNYNNSNFWAGGHCYVLLKISTKLNNIFLYNYLKLIETKIMRTRVGSGLPNIQIGALQTLPILLPSIEEQEKIAKVLSNMDKLIENKQKEIDQVNNFKTYLLQNMFI